MSEVDQVVQPDQIDPAVDESVDKEIKEKSSCSSKISFTKCLICYNSFPAPPIPPTRSKSEDDQMVFVKFATVLENNLKLEKKDILKNWDFLCEKSQNKNPDFLPFCSNCSKFILNISQLQEQLEEVQNDIGKCLEDLKYLFVNSLSHNIQSASASSNNENENIDGYCNNEKVEDFRNKIIPAWSIEKPESDLNDPGFIKKDDENIEKMVLEPDLTQDKSDYDTDYNYSDGDNKMDCFDEKDSDDDEDGIVHLPDSSSGEKPKKRRRVIKSKKIKTEIKKEIINEDESENSENADNDGDDDDEEEEDNKKWFRKVGKFVKYIISSSDEDSDEDADGQMLNDGQIMVVEPKKMKKKKKEKIPNHYFNTGIEILKEPNGDLKCGRCFHIEKTVKLLKGHIKEIHGKERGKIDYMCHYCSKVLTNTRSISRHMKTYHSDSRPTFPCDRCPKILASQEGLTRHKAIRHGEGIELVKSCDICCRPFRHLKDVIAHKWTHLSEDEKLESISKGEIPPESGSICSACGKILSSEMSLRNHEKIHKGIKPFVCHICGKCFGTKANMIGHTLIHNPDESLLKFVCGFPGCPKKFLTKNQLKRHAYVHNKEMAKPYKCPFAGCSLSFLDNVRLRQHTYSHTGERPFNCPTCNKGFTRQTHVNRHLRNVHGIKN